jgi:CheY-like chemotaxis protein
MTSVHKSDFAAQIRLALQNLHDFAALQKLPITLALSAEDRTLDQSVRQLRSEILAAIEQLNPPGNMPVRAKERRPYMLLYGHYVQGMTTAELAEELAISLRQLRREHARALNAVTELLWERLSGRLGQSPQGTQAMAHPEGSTPDATQAETEQLISQAHIDDLALSDLLEGVLTTLAPIAAGRGIALRNQLPTNLPLIRANRVVLRQGLMGLLSYGLQRLQTGEVRIEGSLRQGVTLWVNAVGKFQPGEPGSASLDVSRKLISSLNGKIEIQEQTGAWQAGVTLPIAEDLPVLVMDDNAGLIELFRRYLAGRGYRVLEGHTAGEAIEAARKSNPRLIILDVMMPDQDGWEVLQKLRAAPETQAVPVMICSVLNEPEIAATLGASDYLLKPVTQDALLAKVERWCRAPLLPAAPPTGSPADSGGSRLG